jgi:succinate dehydrogenase / fumarate reductase flavoprotein subunit
MNTDSRQNIQPHNDSSGFTQIPQDILDRLTRVDMPNVKGIDPTGETCEVGGVPVPVYRCEALVLGSGAAGMRAAVELKRRGVDVLIASTGLGSGDHCPA